MFGLFWKLWKSTFQKKENKIYGAQMKSSELFVLNYTVITVTIEALRLYHEVLLINDI